MAETETLAAFVAGTGYDDLPSGSVEAAKRAVRDYAGVALYGSTHPIGERIGDYVDRFAPGEGATTFGRGTASATGAALANGTFGHAIDYDDTFESIVIHPTSPVFPAALAAAEESGVGGRAVLAGYVVGTEVAYRVGHAVDPAHYDNGWHSTGTVGTFGAAAAAGSVLDLDPDALHHAVGIAASSSSALKKNFGSMTKPLHAGHAAQAGLRAALLAGEGFTADVAIFEGDLGYGEVMTPGGPYEPEEVAPGEDGWGVEDVGFKPYPSGVITHAAMEALRRIVEREDLTPGEVASVTVTLDAAASEMLHHDRPEDALQAKFSIEFCLAAVLRERAVTIHEFADEYVRSPETRAAIGKVERDFEANLFGDRYAGYGARVVVETSGGRFQEEERRAPGSPTNPLPEERWRSKFYECAGAALDREDAEALAGAIESLDSDGALERLRTVLREA